MTPASLLQLLRAGQISRDRWARSPDPEEKRLSPHQSPYISMRGQVGWGIALIVIGVVIALIIPIFGIPLVVIGIALIIWRGREEIIEKAEE
jgi:4-hydroxybenzoate polyprenyltransferase